MTNKQFKNVVAIIPARGGSKGIPGKNLKLINGKSLLTRSIFSASNSHLINEVIVSSDDNEILNAAKNNGASIVKRPPELSDDIIISDAAIVHALENYKSLHNYYPDITVFIQCTSPFITSSDLTSAIEKFLEENADSMLTVIPSHKFIWKLDKNGSLKGVNHDMRERLCRQFLSLEFQETGGFYIFDTIGFLKKSHRFFGKVIPFEIEAWKALDIDEPEDLELANIIAKSRGI